MDQLALPLSRVSFLDLALELRHMVYGYYFIDNPQAKQWERLHVPCPDCARTEEEWNGDWMCDIVTPQLFNSCRQIREELTDLRKTVAPDFVLTVDSRIWGLNGWAALGSRVDRMLSSAVMLRRVQSLVLIDCRVVLLSITPPEGGEVFVPWFDLHTTIRIHAGALVEVHAEEKELGDVQYLWSRPDYDRRMMWLEIDISNMSAYMQADVDWWDYDAHAATREEHYPWKAHRAAAVDSFRYTLERDLSAQSAVKSFDLAAVSKVLKQDYYGGGQVPPCPGAFHPVCEEVQWIVCGVERLPECMADYKKWARDENE
ncbi:hypothetical protein ANO11243_019150 [Dothideomycetidae sp. 11243]|nr:hypothetical protein ANO11243_019150 [fungal sp. No.11243]